VLRTAPVRGNPESGERPAGTELRIAFFDNEGRLHSLSTVVDPGGGEGVVIRVPSRGNPTVQVHRRPAHLLPRVADAPRFSLVGVGADSPPLLISARPVDRRPRTAERRHFYRVGVDLEAYGDGWEARVVDLSGGGCRLHVTPDPDTPEVGQRFDLRVLLPTLEPALELSGRVVRSEPAVGGGLWLGVEFVGLAQREQDELVRYVFHRQRELLRWGFIRPA
jgi:hypothetical protein